MGRLLAAAILLLFACSAQAEELLPATPEEERAIAAAVVEGVVALADYDAEKVIATADPMLPTEMLQLRDLALAIPANRFLPPFEGTACAPLWASLRILELRKAFDASTLAALGGEDLLRLAVADSKRAPFLWQSLLNDHNIGLQMRANMKGPAVRALRLGGIAPIYVAGDRAYASISSYEPALVSIALRQPDGRWLPDYRLHLEFYREDEITVEYLYVLKRRDIKPALLEPQEYLAGLLALLSDDPMTSEAVQALLKPPLEQVSVTCLHPVDSPPLVRCPKQAATCVGSGAAK